MSLLAVNQVSRRFGGLVAVSGVTLEVEQGEILGVMGANGAGKTTLFALIAGHLRPNEGTISLDGRPITGLSPDRICRLGLTRTFQIVRPFAGLSVLDNAAIGAFYGARRARNRRAAQDAAQEAIAAVGLAGHAGQSAGTLTLSGQKRLEVARALATGARIILLDEVMAGLTPTEVEEMIDIVAGLRARNGITFLVIEHVMKALVRLSDCILCLHHGEPIAMGSPKTIAHDPKVLDVYYGGDEP